MHLSPLISTTVTHFFTTYLSSLFTACSLFKTPVPELLYPLLNASITYRLLSKLYTGCLFANALNSKLLHSPLKPCSTNNLLIFTSYLNRINLHDLFDHLIYICYMFLTFSLLEVDDLFFTLRLLS